MNEPLTFTQQLDTFLASASPGLLLLILCGLVLLVFLTYKTMGLEYRFSLVCPHCKRRIDFRARTCPHCHGDIYPPPKEKH